MFLFWLEDKKKMEFCKSQTKTHIVSNQMNNETLLLFLSLSLSLSPTHDDALTKSSFNLVIKKMNNTAHHT